MINKSSKLSVKAKVIIIIVIVIVVAITGYVVVRANQIQEQTNSLIMERLQSNANMTFGILETVRNYTMMVLDLAATQMHYGFTADADISQGLVYILNSINRIQDGIHVYENIMAFDHEFNLVAAGNLAGDTVDLAGFYAQYGEEMIALWYSTVFENPLSGRMQILFTQPIMDGGQIIGYVGIIFNTETVLFFLRDFMQAYDSFVNIVDRSGTIFFSNRPLAYMGRHVDDLGVYEAFGEIPMNTVFFHNSALTGIDKIAYVTTDEQLGWTIISFFDADAVESVAWIIFISLLPTVSGIIIASALVVLVIHKSFKAELEYERNIIQIMKDNIPQGVFLMDRDLKILPQYSPKLVSIFSYYEDNMTGKNFFDLLSNSLEIKRLKILKGYFEMMFHKSKPAKVLEEVNPLYEFEYKTKDKTKVLSTKFSLIEKEGMLPAIMGIVQDITWEKEAEKEMKARNESQDKDMKNILDVIQVSPVVFQDFMEEVDSNFNYINGILKNKTMSEREVVTKIFQNIHSIKSNAIILGLENFGIKLNEFEDEIKKVSEKNEINENDILKLALGVERVMQAKDIYIKTIKKIDNFKFSNKLDTVLIHTLKKAVERIGKEVEKIVDIRAGEIDLYILESNLRRPLKDILFQCVRNSIYHGIETSEERLKKNKRKSGLLEFSIKKAGTNAELTFSDDGGGLNWEEIKKKYLQINPAAKDASQKVLLSAIFMPEFSTSKEANMTAGRGVGLSLVRDIVKDNKGKINVNSTDAGLTLKFTFPYT